MANEDNIRITKINYLADEIVNMPNRFITKFPAHQEEFTAIVFNP